MKLSNTALEQYIRCAFQYHEERHNKRKGEPGQSMLMGRVIHRMVERLLKAHKERGKIDFLDIHEATAIYSEEWSVETGLNDQSTFNIGLQQVHDLIENMGQVDPRSILATEQFFSIKLNNDLEIVGVIDLIVGREVVDEETGEVTYHIEVIDWKTSLLFTAPRDAHDSLQLSLYILAAKQLYPEADRITGALYMLNSGSVLKTRRSDHDLAEDILFINAMAKQIENDEQWVPTLNSDCIYCHLRRECPAYKEALEGPMPIVVENEHDLDALAVEREAVHFREKAAKKRKEEIDAIIKSHLKSIGSLELGDYLFKLSQVPKKAYPALETIRLLSERLGMGVTDIVEQVCTIGKKQIDELLNAHPDQYNARMASAALANIVQTTYSSRLYTKKKKPNKQDKKTKSTD
jgi:CRISPR/Cas system-associated exonuclease Cas4 (RecB family)